MRQAVPHRTKSWAAWLDERGRHAAETPSMHQTLLRALPLVALVALAACDNKPTTIVGGGPTDTTAEQIKAAPPVKLPPALLASKSYRCKDNSIVYVDWFNDNTTANLKLKKDGEPHHLAAEAAGQPLSGDGYQLTGTPTAAQVTFTKPGGGGQACDA